MHITKLAIASLILHTLGCSDIDEISIDELDEVSGGVSLGLYMDIDTLTAEIEYAEVNTGSCLQLRTEFSALIDGVAMDVDRGSSYEDDGITYCNRPIMTKVNPPQMDSATLVLSDDTGMLTCNLEALLAPSTVTLVPDGAWQFAAGQVVGVRWFEPDTSVFLGRRGAPERDLELLPSEVQDGVRSFALPSSLDAGEYELEFRALLPRREISSCDLRATAALHARRVEPITIIP
jgi:hypothetical protein